MTGIWVLTLLLYSSPAVIVEQWTCTYRWVGGSENIPMLLEVSGVGAVEHLGSGNSDFRVLENSKDELIVIETFTKQRSGRDYPVGGTLIVIDKASGKMIRSNTFTDQSFNKHAAGTCSLVKK